MKKMGNIRNVLKGKKISEKQISKVISSLNADNTGFIDAITNYYKDTLPVQQVQS